DIAAPVPEPSPPARGGETADSQDMENLVLGVWRAVLGQVPASLEQNFFDAGGPSVGLARGQAAIRTQLGRDLAVVELFAHPTIASLARLLRQTEDAPAGRRHAAPAASLRQAEALRRMALARGGGR